MSLNYRQGVMNVTEMLTGPDVIKRLDDGWFTVAYPMDTQPRFEGGAWWANVEMVDVRLPPASVLEADLMGKDLTDFRTFDVGPCREIGCTERASLRTSTPVCERHLTEILASHGIIDICFWNYP